MTISFQIGFWMAPIAFVLVSALIIVYLAFRDNEPDAIMITLVMCAVIVALMMLTRFLP